jgi:tRNA (adenine22-N1)-methyltransferase
VFGVADKVARLTLPANMRFRALPPRLEAILALLSPCRMLVDVGTDHGLVPLAAVRRGIAERAIASDLRRAPLRTARLNVARSPVSDRVSIVREDGLSGLARRSVDAVVMAGMSGHLIVRLCEAAPHVLEGVNQLVTQPNSDARLVRAWALQHGFHLQDERMLNERGQFFVTCAFEKRVGVDPAYELPPWSTDALCLVGPRLLASKDPAALQFSVQQCERLRALADREVKELLAELRIWQAAREFMRA